MSEPAQTNHGNADSTNINDIYPESKGLNSPYDYDQEPVFSFIDSVFENGVPDGATPLVWASKHNGKIGVPLQQGLSGLERKMNDGKAHALYFNTCSFYPDNGNLNHKHENFAALHVIVSDDVGTKIDAQELISRNLIPTYIIESSKGNFQYGYVLDEAITNFDHATAAVGVFGCAKLTDKGGVIAGKIVRLPGGINGKKTDDKELFDVRLVSNDGPIYTIETLLERVGLNVEGDSFTWSNILAGESPVARVNYAGFQRRPSIHFNTVDMQDVVLDWLNEQGLITGDGGGEWVNITCPWGELHTTGDDTAGYKPVGRGSDPTRRAFKCFHEHCQANHTTEFLQFVLTNSDFEELPMQEPEFRPQDFAFFYPNNKVFNIAGRPYEVDLNGFRNKFNRKVIVLRQKGTKFSWERTTEALYWQNSNYRIDVSEIRSECDQKKVFSDEGVACVNLFSPPKWTDGEFDMALVDPFKKHVEFLVPEPEEQAYFIQWLAAKMQNWAFRGTAIVMTTPSQGLGRNTLALMLAELVGAHNMSPDLSFDEFIHGKFTEWIDNLIVVCSEAIDTSDGNTGRYKAYESLKQRIDTTNTKTRVNPKGVSPYNIMAASSTLIFSNHMDAIALAAGDRRITVLQNPMKPNKPEYYRGLRNWLAANPEWPQHVYRWLRSLDVDMDALSLPLQTVGKQNMIDKNTPKMKIIFGFASAFMAQNDIKYVAVATFANLATLHGFDLEAQRPFFNRCMDEVAYNFATAAKFRIRVKGQRITPRIRTESFVAGGYETKFLNSEATEAMKTEAAEDFARLDEKAMWAYVAERLE
jgi:hypothetical protein